MNGVQIKGTGSLWNVDSDWNGNDGGPLNTLWDTDMDSFNRQFVPVGAGVYNITYQAHGDCIVADVHILGVK